MDELSMPLSCSTSCYFHGRLHSMKSAYRKLCEQESGRTLVDHLHIAGSFMERAIGLLGRGYLDSNEGLWIAPCSGIHTIGMRFPIDVLFLNRHGCALRVAPYVHPWRFCGPVRGARTVIELPAGTIRRQNIRTGIHYVQSEK